MTPDLDRRTALRIAGLGVGTAVAGCLDAGGDGDDTPTETSTRTPTDTSTATPDGSPASVADTASTDLTVRTDTPEWAGDRESGPRGYAVVVDSESRQRAALEPFDLSEERRAAVDEFLADADYERDRLVVLESVGPDTCHDRVGVADVRVADGTLRADAAVVDTRQGDEGCGDAITYPSALLLVTFEGDPPDTARVAFTDGWGDSGTVTASTDDPPSEGTSGDSGQ